MNHTVTLINDKEINIPKKQGLREISFDFLIPCNQKYPFATYHLGNATSTLITSYLWLWKKMQIPLPFIVVRMTPKGNITGFDCILCVIEDFTYSEDAETYGLDINCSINLKEYNPYSTKIVEVKDDGKGHKRAKVKKERSTADRQKKSEIKPKKGESAISASKREGYKPADVAKANGYSKPTTSAESLVSGMPSLSESLQDALSNAANNDVSTDVRLLEKSPIQLAMIDGDTSLLAPVSAVPASVAKGTFDAMKPQVTDPVVGAFNWSQVVAHKIGDIMMGHW